MRGAPPRGVEEPAVRVGDALDDTVSEIMSTTVQLWYSLLCSYVLFENVERSVAILANLLVLVSDRLDRPPILPVVAAEPHFSQELVLGDVLRLFHVARPTRTDLEEDRGLAERLAAVLHERGHVRDEVRRFRPLWYDEVGRLYAGLLKEDLAVPEG